MSGFSDADWDRDSIFGVLDAYGFFPYSGADGDLFRMQGLAGWRVSVYGRYYVRIQKKGRPFRGRNTWRTARVFHTEAHANDDPDVIDELGELDAEAIQAFEDELSTLVDEGELQFPREEYVCETDVPRRAEA